MVPAQLAASYQPNSQSCPMHLHACYVTVSDLDDQYFQVSFDNEHPAADYDSDAPLRPYLLLQRQFEDDDGGVCYLWRLLIAS